MFRRGTFFVRLIGALLIIGVLFAAGIGFFNAGRSQGYALGFSAAQSTQGLETQPPGPAAWPGYWPGYYYPYRGPFFGFSPFGPLLGLLLTFGLLFLAFGGLRMLFRPFWGPYPHMGHWRHAHPHPWAGGSWNKEAQTGTQPGEPATPPTGAE